MSPLMLIHIGAGTVALLSGAAALSLRKGGPRHGQAGQAFAIAMLVLGGTAAFLAPFATPTPDRVAMAGGIFVMYLVATSWVTARNRDGKAGRFEIAALVVTLGCAAAFLTMAYWAKTSPTGKFDGYSPSTMYANAFLALLAAALDVNFLVRQTLTGIQRLARHLWRMCVALFMAAGAFFLGQQDTMPQAIQGSRLLFVLTLAALVPMAFWLFRLRFAKAYKRGARTAGALFERIKQTDRAQGAA